MTIRELAAADMHGAMLHPDFAVRREFATDEQAAEYWREVRHLMELLREHFPQTTQGRMTE